MGFLKNIFGTADDEEEYLDIEDNQGYDISSSAVTDEEAGYTSSYTPPMNSYGSSKAISIHEGSHQSARIMIMKPATFEEMMNDAIISLREGRIIFLNLTETRVDEGARIVDFMTGAAGMCGGNINNVANRCYVVSPKNVEINVIKE